MFRILSKKSLLFLAVGLCVLIGVLFMFRDSSDDLVFDALSVGNDASMNKEVFHVDSEAAQSYYVLDSLKFFAVPTDNKYTYVQCVISLAYPKNSVKHENDIISHRENIKKYVQSFLSQKTFHQLQYSESRKRMTSVLVRGLNELLNYGITNVYFIEFFVIQKDRL